MPLARFSAMTKEGRIVTENAKVPSSIPGRTNPLSTFSKKQKFLTYRTVYLTTSYGGVLKIINSQIEPLCSSLFVFNKQALDRGDRRTDIPSSCASDERKCRFASIVSSKANYLVQDVEFL